MLAIFLKIVFRNIFRNIIFRKNKTYALFLKIKSSEVCLWSMKVKWSDLLFEFSKIKTNVIHKKSLCSKQYVYRQEELRNDWFYISSLSTPVQEPYDRGHQIHSMSQEHVSDVRTVLQKISMRLNRWIIKLADRKKLIKQPNFSLDMIVSSLMRD